MTAAIQPFSILEPITEAVKQSSLIIIKEISKSELHLHLGGAWPLSYLAGIAEPSDYLNLTQFLNKIKDGIDYHEGFKIFNLIGKIVNTEEKVQNGVIALCNSHVKDNITYAELRTGLKSYEGAGFESHLQALLRGIQQGTTGKNLQVNLILSLRRDTPEKDAIQTLELALKYRSQGVVGLDLSGDSTQGDGCHVLPILKKAREYGLPVTLHLGESDKETEEQQIKELTEIQPKRIGHGVFLKGKALEWVLKNKTPVELCLTSALKVRMITNPGDHPAIHLIHQKHPVVICTDDPLLFDVSLSEECVHVAQAGDFSVSDIIALQEQASQYRFMQN